jgi:hypothetical protein
MLAAEMPVLEMRAMETRTGEHSMTGRHPLVRRAPPIL